MADVTFTVTLTDSELYFVSNLEPHVKAWSMLGTIDRRALLKCIAAARRTQENREPKGLSDE